MEREPARKKARVMISLLMSSYQQLRNKVNSLNTKLKRQYFATRVSKFKGNMKVTWKTINQLLNKRSKST